MIIEFTVANFKSIREPATISFQAGKSKSLPGNLLKLPNGEKILKSMALYGPNASGKTTFLDALFALRQIVLFSSSDQQPNFPIPRVVPFALDRKSEFEVTSFQLTFDLGGDRYVYLVKVTRSQVWHEKLSVQYLNKQPSRKAKLYELFNRKWEPNHNKYIHTIKNIETNITLDYIELQTTPNRLMLGKLAALNNPIAAEIVQWFDEDIKFYDMHRSPNSEKKMLGRSAELMKSNPEFAKNLTRFLGDADTGIESIIPREEPYLEKIRDDFDQHVGYLESTRTILAFQHKNEEGIDRLFQIEMESSGTRRFLAMLVAILEPSNRRRLICIDEISASMHPELVQRLIQVIHSSKYNPKGNQVLFTSHDTHLLDPTELLRRDQVTICDKNRFGITSTVRLDEFQDDVRSDANLQKQYLQGRFGGIPQFGILLEDVPVDEEPLEIGA